MAGARDAPTVHGGWRLGRETLRPPDTPQGKINVTDLDSRTLKKVGGYVQGYNAQAVVTEDQVIVAAESRSRRKTSGISDRSYRPPARAGECRRG